MYPICQLTQHTEISAATKRQYSASTIVLAHLHLHAAVRTKVVVRKAILVWRCMIKPTCRAFRALHLVNIAVRYVTNAPFYPPSPLRLHGRSRLDNFRHISNGNYCLQSKPRYLNIGNS